MFSDEILTVRQNPFFQNGFKNEDVRRNFITKVYGMLLLQLAITGATLAIMATNRGMLRFICVNAFPLMILNIVLFLVLITLVARFKFTLLNFFLMIGFNVTNGMELAVISAGYTIESLLIAVAMTEVLFSGLTLYGFITKRNFTLLGSILFNLLLGLLACSISGWFFPGQFIDIVLAVFASLVFCTLIIYDTQMIVSGKYHQMLDPEEYLFASLSVYLDTINLFLNILKIVGYNDNRRRRRKYSIPAWMNE